MQLAVATVLGVEFRVGAPLDDLAGFQHENLVGAADRGKPMRDDKRGAALLELLQPLLDERLALAV